MTSPMVRNTVLPTYAELARSLDEARAEMRDLAERNARLEAGLDKAVRLVDEIDKLSALFWAA